MGLMTPTQIDHNASLDEYASVIGAAEIDEFRAFASHLYGRPIRAMVRR